MLIGYPPRGASRQAGANRLDVRAIEGRVGEERQDHDRKPLPESAKKRPRTSMTKKAVAYGHTSLWGTQASIVTFAGAGPRDAASMFGPVVRKARTGISDTVSTARR
jgi:hypothetical protein